LGIPGSLEAACAARLETLAGPARRLLEILIAAGGTADPEEAFRVGGDESINFYDARLVLRSQGLIDGTEDLRLAHPGLIDAYRKAMGPAALSSAHRAWKDALLSVSSPEPNADSRAPRIVRHALACEDTATARLWGGRAVESLFGAGRYAETADLASSLLPFSEDRTEIFVLHGYRGPALYRLGRFEESIRAYDDWYRIKGDDETRVEMVKHRLFTDKSSWPRERRRRRSKD
jgi:hypothetical protein